ncbi:GTP pyrophosphokinase family protein [Shewanella xiamenensis]|uniref:GTP pyrophosphokinase n=1 Tax=Shewanella xiamenensis TaxID=332186 RepID=UPI00217A0C31|nr:hypothetical protein [Shewanella xiamenensis]BDQ67714.1 hypothetical protein NUITMVS2_35260 [Shewanella xiamenensis]GLD77205.1 hypothetical protein NUITMVS3_16360 [Shewanella xiamenensis]
MPDFIETYKELKPKYTRLESNIYSFLQQALDENNISIFNIESRVKDDKSVQDKIISKGYQNPLTEIEDFCGVRVICYYQEDISKICDIIKNNFDVIKEDNKQSELSDNQFGYSSFHYIIKIKEEWLGHPSAKGLKDFKSEVQIRTMLMHTWSAISHKLLYKKEQDIPSHFKRKLNRLSALIELADEQFDQIKNEKIEYNSSLTTAKHVFDLNAELNSDSLKAIQSYYFKERNSSDNQIPNLLDEIRSADLSLYQFVNALHKCLEFFPEMEQEEADQHDMELPLWGFAGIVRTVLDICSPKYFANRKSTLPNDVIEIREKYRAVYESKI